MYGPLDNTRMAVLQRTVTVLAAAVAVLAAIAAALPAVVAVLAAVVDFVVGIPLFLWRVLVLALTWLWEMAVGLVTFLAGVLVDVVLRLAPEWAVPAARALVRDAQTTVWWPLVGVLVFGVGLREYLNWKATPADEDATPAIERYTRAAVLGNVLSAVLYPFRNALGRLVGVDSWVPDLVRAASFPSWAVPVMYVVIGAAVWASTASVRLGGAVANLLAVDPLTWAAVAATLFSWLGWADTTPLPERLWAGTGGSSAVAVFVIVLIGAYVAQAVLGPYLDRFRPSDGAPSDGRGSDVDADADTDR